MKQFIFKKDPAYSNCPACKSFLTLHRSRVRNWQETVIKSFTFFKTYRCKKCGWRGYKSTFSFSLETLKVLLIYAGMAIVAGFIVLQILKKYVSN